MKEINNKDLFKLAYNAGLYVEFEGDKLKGTALNILNYPIFRLWINKSNNLTVKTRGVQKSFKEWKNEKDFYNILTGFEIL